jgi:multiple sugar transport system substrate-binding protein
MRRSGRTQSTGREVAATRSTQLRRRTMHRAHQHRVPAVLLVALLVAVAATASTAGGQTYHGLNVRGAASEVAFMSDQASELTEAQAFQTYVLNGYAHGVNFVPVPDGTTPLTDRLRAEAQSGHGSTDLAGGLHSDFDALKQYGLLTDLSGVAAKLKNAGIAPALLKLGKLGTNKQYYIPWMQATYVMAANKKALPYLPKGAKLGSLTYAQLFQWAKNIYTKTGQPELGLPVNGLIKRFVEGYLLPSFTGGVVTTFRSPQAVAGWKYMQQLWKYVNPQSITYSFMQDPLQSGEVWIAWDHVARLQNALEANPNQYVVFPAPSGPKGRGFMPVVVGLAIPKSAPDPAAARPLINYLLTKSAQAKTLYAVGYFPVVAGHLSTRLNPGLRLESNAIKLQQTAKDALPSLLPVGLGDSGGDFDKAYSDTFMRIVVNHEDPSPVVNNEAATIQQIINQAGAHCWAPDPPSSGPCQVK